MKINKVTLENINSLQGTYEINFEEDPLSGASLFAITGPTGSGKSTILDGITLALYKKIPRGGEVNRNTILEGYILNKNSRHCSATIDYESGGRRYRSQWYIEHNRNNNLNDYDMAVWDLENNEMLNERKSEVESINTRLTGLTYDQFLKSIMLSQGEFDRFLKANDNEKTHLLEKITGGEIYKTIGSRVYARKSEEDNNLAHLKTRKEGYSVWSEEDEASQRKALTEISERIKKLEADREQLHGQINRKKEIKDLSEQIRQETQQLEEVRKSFEAHQDQFRMLDNHQQLSEYQVQFHSLEETERSLSNQRGEKTKIEDRIETTKSNIAEESTTYQNLKAEVDAIHKEKVNIEELMPRVRQLDQDIQAKNAEKSRMEKEMGEKQQKAQQFKASIGEKDQKIEGLNKDIKALTQWKEAHQLLETYQKNDRHNLRTHFDHYMREKEEVNGYKKSLTFTIPGHAMQDMDTFHQYMEKHQGEINSQLREYSEGHRVLHQHPERLPEWWQLLSQLNSSRDQLAYALEQKQAAEQEKATLNPQIQETQATLQQQKTERQQLKETLDEKQARFNTLREELNHLKLEEKYLADRTALTEGDPCPLCGATHHPYAGESSDEAFQQKLQEKEKQHSDLEKEIDQEQQKINNLDIKTGQTETTLANLQESLQKAEQRLREAGENLRKHVSTLQTVRDNFREKISENKLAAYFPIEGDFGEDFGTAQLEALKAETSNIESRLKDLQEALQKYRDLNADLESLNNILTRLEKVRQEKTALDEHLAPYQELVDGKAGDYKTQLSILDDLGDQWDNTLEKLSQKQQELALQKQARSSEAENLGSIETEIEQLKGQLDKLNPDLEAQQNQRQKLFGSKDPDQEYQKINNSYEHKRGAVHESEKKLENYKANLEADRKQWEQLTGQIDQLEEKRDSLQAALLKVLEPLGYETIAEAREQMLTREKAEEIKGKRKQLQEQYSNTQSRLEDRKKQYQDKEDPAPEQSLETLEEQYNAVEAEHRQKLQNEATLNAQIKENEARKKSLEELQSQIEAQKAIVQKWDRLNGLIGDAQGRKFSKIAQSITLEMLVAFANHKIGYFSDRYQIRKKEDQRPDQPRMEMVVIDLYMANQERAMNTLSGGETFLLSLSMALALADLAGAQTQIENLFIDEGFGSLDEESLDHALNALETLQIETNRKIGVISHVKALQDRIPVHIRVDKAANGNSRIILPE